MIRICEQIILKSLVVPRYGNVFYMLSCTWGTSISSKGDQENVYRVAAPRRPFEIQGSVGDPLIKYALVR